MGISGKTWSAGQLSLVVSFEDSRQRERCDLMIVQPEWGTRNVNRFFYESEARKIAALNEIFGEVELTTAEMRTLVWLAGWEESTVATLVSAIRKAMAAKVTKSVRRIRR